MGFCGFYEDFGDGAEFGESSDVVAEGLEERGRAVVVFLGLPEARHFFHFGEDVAADYGALEGEGAGGFAVEGFGRRGERVVGDVLGADEVEEAAEEGEDTLKVGALL